MALLEAEQLLQPHRVKHLARLRRLLLPKRAAAGVAHPDKLAQPRPQVSTVPCVSFSTQGISASCSVGWLCSYRVPSPKP